MISILIPTYNYDAYPLAKELHQQCKSLNILFEILINDDASTINFTNIKNNELSNHCSVFTQNENKGLSFSRNFLISKAKYNWMLLLDSDVKPTDELFIKKYIDAMNLGYQIINGGLQYHTTCPDSTELLRWKYGHNREALNLQKRIKNNNGNSFLSSNLLVHKSVFERIKYEESLDKYGYEDLVFQKQTLQNHFKILQIDNPVYHLKLDTSEVFINKSKQSLKNLKYLVKHKQLSYNDTKISKIYSQFNHPVIQKIVVSFFTVFEKKMYNHLKSPKTSLWVFDLYRLGYFYKISRQ